MYFNVSCTYFFHLFTQTSILNAHLSTLMEGLTAKVFRTYNASRTLQEQLDLLTVRKCHNRFASQLGRFHTLF